MTGQAGVAAGHDATAAAAVEVLGAGGNAIDAAVAAVFTACVAEPVLTAPLGAGVLTYRPAEGPAVVLDFFAQVPGLGRPVGDAAELDFVGVDVDFGPAVQVFHIGRGSAAVPGTVAGMFEAHRRWGRMPMLQLVEPACEVGRAGARVTASTAQVIDFLSPILLHSPASAALFAPDGDVLTEGDTFRNPDLSVTLEAIAREGPDLVYAGELADRVVDSFGGELGLLTHDDLRSYAPRVLEPLVVSYRGAEVLLPPRPTAGGPLVAHSLALLGENGRLPPFDSDAYLLEMARVMRATNEARSSLLNVLGSTTHLGVVDGHGNAVGVTTSNGESCGHVVPGTGIVMNNFLGEADINPDGFHRQPAGERMLTMMCPTIATEASGRTSVLGTGGSNRIRSVVLQVLVRLLDHDLPMDAAVRAPRLHVEGETCNIETWDVSPAALTALRKAFSDVPEFPDLNIFFGGLHAVRVGPEGADGAGDPRRGGVFRALTG